MLYAGLAWYTLVWCTLAAFDLRHNSDFVGAAVGEPPGARGLRPRRWWVPCCFKIQASPSLCSACLCLPAPPACLPAGPIFLAVQALQGFGGRVSPFDTSAALFGWFLVGGRP